MKQFTLLQWLLILLTTTSLTAQNLDWLGTPPGYASSRALALTPDGSEVLVQSYDTTLIQVLTTLWESSSQSHTPINTSWIQLQGYDIAGDGETVVGIGVPEEGDDLQPFLRRADTVIALSVPEGTWYAIARSISQNGRVIVGSWVDSVGISHACWWNSMGEFSELPLPKDGEAEAVDVSANGDEILGILRTDKGEFIVLLWRRKGDSYVVEQLPVPANYLYASARAISSDGTFVVGAVADTSLTPLAAVWDLRHSPVEVYVLPLPDDIRPSEALVVSNTTASMGSSDPTILGRWIASSGEERIFRWTAQTGFEDLSYTYAALLQDSSLLGTPTAITPDGSVIVGQGYNGASQRIEAYRLSISNFPPSIPEMLSPDSAAQKGPTPTFVVRGEDPNGDSVRYEIAVWQGTDVRTYRTDWVASGEPDSVTVPQIASLSSGQWWWRVRAEDKAGTRGSWSDSLSFSVTSPNRVEPGQGVEIQQVHFSFSGIEEPFSAWGRLSVDRVTLTGATDLAGGYLNLFTDLGWVVQNLWIDSTDTEVVTYFALAAEDGQKVDTLSGYVIFTPKPVPELGDGPRLAFPVDRVVWNAEGAGEGTVSHIGVPPSPNMITFDPSGLSWKVTQPHDTNVQAAKNQCFPMAIANSLQYLKNRYQLNIPHAHRPGLRGDTVSIVGWLDSLANRFAPRRDSGRGVWFQPMLRGKFAYLERSGLQNALVHKHQGRGYGDSTQGQALPPGNFTSSGITSYDSGAVVSWQWICDEIRRGEDVEIVFSYDSAGHPRGGHAVRVFECGQTLGIPWIGYLHDREQSNDTAGLEKVRVYVLDTDGDGIPNLGSNSREIRFALSESIKEATGMQPKRSVPLKLWIEPLPVVEGARLHYRLPEPQPIRIAIVDLMGRTAAVLAEGFHKAGGYTIGIPALPSGIYMVVVHLERDVVTYPFVVAR